MPESLIETPAELARRVVDQGVAPCAALGWAVRVAGRWEVSAGEARGTTPEGTPRSAGGDAIFDLASVTKPMTALAIARSGLRRSELLGDLVAQVAGTASATVPLELFLAHRGGLDGHRSLYQPVVEGRAFVRDDALRTAAEAWRRDALDALDANGAIPASGFAPVYSDLGYLLAGEALASKTGHPDAGAAIEALVVQALGLESELGTARTLASRNVDFDGRVVPTETVAFRGGTVRGIVHDENAWAASGPGGEGHAGMFGTVRAVLAFGGAALDAIERGEGPLACGGQNLRWLSDERPGGTLRAGFDGKSASGSSAGERAGPRTFGHLGFTGTSLWIDPDADAVVVLLTNRVHPTRENAAIRAARPWVHDALFAMAARHRARHGDLHSTPAVST